MIAQIHFIQEFIFCKHGCIIGKIPQITMHTDCESVTKIPKLDFYSPSLAQYFPAGQMVHSLSDVKPSRAP